MSAVDHRAEAERRAADAPQFWDDKKFDRALFEVKLAHVHATLAAGTPVADQHLTEAARRYTALRDDLLELIAAVGPELTDAGFGAIVDRLRELAGEVTP